MEIKKSDTHSLSNILKTKLIFFITILFFSCDLSFFIPDKEPPQISWQKYRINDNDFIEFEAENLDINDAFEILEFRVKVTDDGSDINKVELYIVELDTIIMNTNKAMSDDVYSLKWNTTLEVFDDSIYTVKVLATDSNENKKTSSALNVKIDQSNGFPYSVEVLSVINNLNNNCIYWDSDNLLGLIPDFSHYNIYKLQNDTLIEIVTIESIDSNSYCTSEDLNNEHFYNVSAVDTFGLSSIIGSNFSNLVDYNPIPINFTNIEYTGDSIAFDWELSPDIDFDRYELWYYCQNCEFSNTPIFLTTNQSLTSVEINLFKNDGQYENIYPNKSNEFWIKVFDSSNNLSVGNTYTTQPDYPPSSVNVKSINYSIDGINIEWYINEEDILDFKSYNIYHSFSELGNKNIVKSINDISLSTAFVDSGFISENGNFSFKDNFNPFYENWFWIGVEDIYGNISIGSGMTNLIDTPPPASKILDWTYWKRDENSDSGEDTIIVYWQSFENRISDFESYTIYRSTSPDSIQDTLGTVYDISQNYFQFSYNWDDEVNCNKAGELYFWGKTRDAWGQESISESVLFTEQPPQKPSITSIYYESIENEYVIEWKESEDLDFQSYTIYYKHDENFYYDNIFDDNCNDNSLEHINDSFICPDDAVCHIKITNQEETQFVYNLIGDDWTMFFLVVTDDVWGMKAFSTQESDCNSESDDCGNAEKATPFNQIFFQSPDRGLGNKIYSVELDFEDEQFPRINLATDLDGDSFYPIFEPWGARVTFYAWENDNMNYEIYSIGAGGNNVPINLTNHPGNDFNPKYCAEGSKIIFESWRSGNCELFSMNKDGTNTIRLTYNNGTDEDFQIANSTGGMDKIIYVSTVSGNREIYIMNENGTEIQNLTSHPSDQYDPDISEDGEQIVYIGENNGEIDLYWENISTGDSLKITNNNSIERNPQFVMNGFNPNGDIGNFLVYESNLDGSWSLYFQKLPSYNDDIDNFFINNLPINFLNKNSSDQSNPNFANIILDLDEGTFMVFESTEDGTSSIYIVDQFGNTPLAIPSGRISDNEGNDYLPQIQP